MLRDSIRPKVIDSNIVDQKVNESRKSNLTINSAKRTTNCPTVGLNQSSSSSSDTKKVNDRENKIIKDQSLTKANGEISNENKAKLVSPNITYKHALLGNGTTVGSVKGTTCHGHKLAITSDSNATISTWESCQ